jgi:DNA-binding NarL/FixJ family response regulator
MPSERQLQVCRLRAEGLSAREVADRLKISKRTVEVHMQNAYSTLGVHNVMQMAIALSKFSERAEAAHA